MLAKKIEKKLKELSKEFLEKNDKDMSNFVSYVEGRIGYLLWQNENYYLDKKEFSRMLKAAVSNLCHGFHYNGREPVTIFSRLACNKEIDYERFVRKVPEIAESVFATSN